MKLLLKLFLLISIAATVSFINGCRNVPYTNRSQMLFTSEEQEKSLGQQAWRKVLQESKQSYNRKENEALQRVGRNIAAVAEKPDYNWEFRVFINPSPNAFCLPGGKVGVTDSLFKYTANDAELATVVGHEIAHAIARHGGERIAHGMLQQLGFQALAFATAEGYYLLAYGVLTNVGGILPYSRTHEYEADHIGLLLMAKAGYDPRAAIPFWIKFGKESSKSKIMEFFSTHPLSEERLDEMRKLQSEALKLYYKAPVKRGLGDKL